MSEYRGNIYKLLDELEFLGEDKVRARIPFQEEYGSEGSPVRKIVDEWLEAKSSVREAFSQLGSGSREEEVNLLTRQANTIALAANVSAREANAIARTSTALASCSNRIAIAAMIISALTAIAAIIVTIIMESSKS